MMIVRTKFAKRIDISYNTDDEADTIIADINLQLRGHDDFENGRIVVDRNTDKKTVYVIFYEDCTCWPLPKISV